MIKYFIKSVAIASVLLINFNLLAKNVLEKNENSDLSNIETIQSGKIPYSIVLYSKDHSTDFCWITPIINSPDWRSIISTSPSYTATNTSIVDPNCQHFEKAKSTKFVNKRTNIILHDYSEAFAKAITFNQNSLSTNNNNQNKNLSGILSMSKKYNDWYLNI